MRTRELQEIVDEVRDAYEILAPQGLTDAYGGAESFRVTAQMLQDPKVHEYDLFDFVKAVQDYANDVFGVLS